MKLIIPIIAMTSAMSQASESNINSILDNLNTQNIIQCDTGCEIPESHEHSHIHQPHFFSFDSVASSHNHLLVQNLNDVTEAEISYAITPTINFHSKIGYQYGGNKQSGTTNADLGIIWGLVQKEQFHLSTITAVSVPSGSLSLQDDGYGSELGLLSWTPISSSISISTSLVHQYSFEQETSQLSSSLGISWIVNNPANEDHHDKTNQLTLTLEGVLVSQLKQNNQPETLDVILGANYVWFPGMNLRTGYIFNTGKNGEKENAFILGFNLHF